MAQRDSRRLSIVLPYLYPDLKSGLGRSPESVDYHLQNDGDGTYLVWKNSEITEPTAQELADAKEDALNDFWWGFLRKRRNEKLVESDWSQGEDVPSDLKSSYVTYRNDLRNLPTTVIKSDFETLNNQSINEWNIDSLMPTKPS